MSLFRVQDHVLDASYIREYPRALADEEETDLKVSVKQYTPLDNSSPRTGDITIIGGHANGFPKVYHPGQHPSDWAIVTNTRLGTVRAPLG